MSKKYENLAKEIVKKIGGKENVINAYHCQTRLRFTLADEKNVDDNVVGNIDGVVKVIRNAGVYQVVIGTHVADVYEEIEKLVDNDASNEVQGKNEKKNAFEVISGFLTGIFQPIVPALAGAGMVKAFLALLVVFGLITKQSQTYYIISMFADGVFYFMPMLLAFTSAQKLKCNPIMAVGVAAMMLHPNWSALVSAKEPVSLFGVIPFTLTLYSSSVIPIILIIVVQSFVEKTLKRMIHNSVEIVFVPLLTFLIMGTLAFAVLGPIGAILGGYLGAFFTFLNDTASWAPALIVGGTQAIMVIFGLQNGIAPLGVMQMSDVGYDSIFGPGALCSNMALATAGAVVAFRTKDKKTRTIATSGSVTAYMGITEPILYGVILPKKYPLIAAMIGGASGGAFAGLTHTHRYATGSSGLPAILLYLGDDTTKFFVNIIIAIIISVVVTGIITFILSLKFEENDKKTENDDAVKMINILSPVKGEVFPLSTAKDEAFSAGLLGKGVVIVPSEGIVKAPFDATVVSLFPTNHAIGLRSDQGVEVLIHIGINTVDLQGKCFSSLVKQEDKVKAGDALIEFDIQGIKDAGLSEQTMVTVTNSEDYSEVNIKSEFTANSGENIISLVK